MPANRSRTENWYSSLQQIASRAGGLEIALQHDAGDGAAPGQPTPDLLWRCRLYAVTPEELIVETPAAVGQSFSFSTGARLVVSMSIGQNRWMFSTSVVGTRRVRTPSGHTGGAMVLQMPDHVERCSRRAFMRLGAQSVNLPTVQCWPLLDPSSVVAAEAANRVAIASRMPGLTGLEVHEPLPEGSESLLLPSVGPSFPAQLMNISGGGLGLLVSQAHAGPCERHTFLWLRVDLAPQVPLPLALTVRRAHSHLDSAQNIYLGLAADFTYHPQHQAFVTQVLAQYVDQLQAAQARGRMAG